MSNKFLEKYPALHEPCIGDRIQVKELISIKSGHNHYKHTPYNIGDTGIILGDIGILIPMNNIKINSLYKIDFNNQGNKNVKDNGIWCLWKEEFNVIDINHE